MSECVSAGRLVIKQFSACSFESFRNNNNICACLYITSVYPCKISCFHVLVYYIKIYRNLREQNTVGFCAYTAAQGCVANIPSEDFNYKNTVVTHACSFKVSCKNRYPVDCRIASYTVRLKVEVHGFWNMDTRDSLRSEVDNNASRVIAAAYNQRVYSEFFKALFYTVIFLRVGNFAYFHP